MQTLKSKRSAQAAEAPADESAVLAAKAAAGDSDAFEQLVKKYERFVYTTVCYLIKNREDAFDVSQEVFLRIYRSLASFRGDSSFATWLYRICKNACFDFLRKNAKHHADISTTLYDENEDDTILEIPDSSRATDPEAAYEQLEQKEAIRFAITRLSPEHREIILLRDLEGYSYIEISEMLEMEQGTVKSRLSRARQALKNILTDMNLI